jgi:hypothetical protein
MDFNDVPRNAMMESLIAEVAKAMNEIRHAQDDLDKADSRLRFIIAAIHNLKNRDIKE